MENHSKSVLIITNPRAGKLKTKKYLSLISNVFIGRGYDVTTRRTRWHRDAASIAHSQASKYDLVVCCGGDGTLNEVVSGLMTLPSPPPLGYIPMGTTNDFASSLGISRDFIRTARKIIDGTPRKIDIGEMNGRYFTYISSFGAFTESSYSTPQNAKNILGHMAYVLDGVAHLTNIKPYKMTIETVERTCCGEYLFGAISNSTSIAGLIKLDSSLVDLADGKFEIMLIKLPKTPVQMQKLINSLILKQFDSEFIEFFHSSHIKISTETPVSWTLDGEYGDKTTFVEIINHPQALTIII